MRAWVSAFIGGFGFLAIMFGIIGLVTGAFAQPAKVVCIENLSERLFGELVLTQAPKRGKRIYRAYIAPQNRAMQFFDVVLDENDKLPHYMYIFKGYTNSSILIRVYDVDTKKIKNRDAVAHYSNGKYHMFFRDCIIKK